MAPASWSGAEMAKRRLLFQLGELGLPVTGRDERAGRGLGLRPTLELGGEGHHRPRQRRDPRSTWPRPTTVAGKRLRLELNEPYRTVLGHFRHEIGHYYWPILVTGADALGKCRELFGDDREDYAQAVERHYRPGPHDDWADRHISRLRHDAPLRGLGRDHSPTISTSSTPCRWPTASVSGPASGPERRRAARSPRVIDRWLELSLAPNQVNRCLGHSDLYPFVIARTVMRKLAFVDFAVHDPIGAGRPLGSVRGPQRPVLEGREHSGSEAKAAVEMRVPREDERVDAGPTQLPDGGRDLVGVADDRRAGPAAGPSDAGPQMPGDVAFVVGLLSEDVLAVHAGRARVERPGPDPSPDLGGQDGSASGGPQPVPPPPSPP